MDFFSISVGFFTAIVCFKFNLIDAYLCNNCFSAKADKNNMIAIREAERRYLKKVVKELSNQRAR